MRLILFLLPTFLLVVYGQLITKWRVGVLSADLPAGSGPLERLTLYVTDPYILSAYAAALGGSVTWMFVIESFPVSLAFPLYIGLTVVAVVLAGAWLFGEPLTPARILAVALILAGIVVGSRS